MKDFLLWVKTTIDRYGADFAAAKGIAKKVDLDDITNTKALLASDDTAVVWSIETLSESPVDPMYSLVFTMGIRIATDPANYTMMDLVGSIGDLFSVGDNIIVRDYLSADPLSDNKGDFTISSVRIDPQQFDNVSGIRVATIYAKAVRVG